MLTSVCSHAAVQLGKSLFPLFALALDLPEDFFVDKVCHLHSVVTVFHFILYVRQKILQRL